MKWTLAPLAIMIMISCKQSTVKEDHLYSRHLQRQVQLTVIHTPISSDKSGLNLLILNDGQEMGAFRVQSIVDSLYRAGKIQPLVVVGVHAGDRLQEYGVADQPNDQGQGTRAGYYDAFLLDELYPYAKKMAGVRKFNSVAIAGCSLGGLAAFDLAWDHADKIDKVGVFSGSFWWRDKPLTDSSYSDETDRIMLSKIRSSRKRPKLQYWFYTGGAEETGDRNHNGVIDVMDDTRDLIAFLEKKSSVQAGDITLVEEKTGKHDYDSWSRQLPAFLLWAFGK